MQHSEEAQTAEQSALLNLLPSYTHVLLIMTPKVGL